MNFFASIFQEVRGAFTQPDPKRFAALSKPAPNWFGELEGKAPQKQRTGPTLVDEVRSVWEFDRTIPDIPAHLTAVDIEALKSYGLDPNNPAYSKCKAYFSKQPYCTKADLAANSGGDDHEGIKAHTAKDVLAAFRKSVVGKPSF
jgi:hypothetical protein